MTYCQVIQCQRIYPKAFTALNLSSTKTMPDYDVKSYKVGDKLLNSSREDEAAVYTEALGALEGIENHTDTRGISTNAYGVVNDMKNHPSATKKNRAAAKSLGIDLDKAKPEQSKQVATYLVEKSAKYLAKKVPNWEKLNDMSKSFMLDFHYNGNIKAIKLPKALERYQQDPSQDNLTAIGREARRFETVNKKKRYTKGLDNRVAKLMKHFKLISKLDEAKKYGLPLASDK